MKPSKATLKTLFLVLDITLSFVFAGVYAEFFPKSMESVIVAFCLIPFTVVAFLQILFIPQISLILLTVLCAVHLARDRKNATFKMQDLIEFILLFLWGLAGMYPSWLAFQALLHI